MSKKETAIDVVSKSSTIRTQSHISDKTLSSDEFGAALSTEVVSEEDKRFEEALVRKASSPTDSIRESSRIQPPLVNGALANVENLRVFLSALEEVVPIDSRVQILSSAKIVVDSSVNSRLLIEGGSHNVWTLAAMDVDSKTVDGFQAVLPLHRANNVLRTVSSVQREIMIGVDEGGVCIGPYAVPFGGMVKDFPSQPVVLSHILRAAIPAFYFKEIVDKVMPARSVDSLQKREMQGVLLDFDECDVDGEPSMVCTAVATDGIRIHILRMPRMILESRLSRTPPAVRVSSSLFRYVSLVAGGQWAGLEFGPSQLVAKGKDFLAIAKATLVPQNERTAFSSWRSVNIEYPGCWMIDSDTLTKAIEGVPDKKFQLKIDSIYNVMKIFGEAKDGTTYRIDLTAKCCGGAPLVDVCMSKKYLLDAVAACTTKLVRMSFEHDLRNQGSSAVVVRGEDEQFKAIVMPIRKGDIYE